MSKEKLTKSQKDSGAKKKLSRKGKNIIRKSIAGVLMATALVVAAAPTDMSGVASAHSTDIGNPALNYDADSKLARNGNFVVDAKIAAVLNPDNYKNEIYTSYEIKNINGNDFLVWQYEYYIPESVGGSTVGVVSGFNSSYASDTLNLNNRIYSGYDFVTPGNYEDFWKNHTADDYSIKTSLPTDDLLKKVERYFYDNQRYIDWRSSYDAGLAKYAQDNPGSLPTSLAEINVQDLDLKAGDMTSSIQKIYYCDKNSLEGYTLKLVSNVSQWQDYRKVDGSKGTIPPDSELYIVYLNNASEIQSAGEKYDANGFKYIDFQEIGAIANNAFKDDQNVKKLIVSDGIMYVGDSAFENSFINEAEFASVNYFGNSVFKNCDNLTSADLDGVENIGKEAFYGCKAITSINVPSSVKQIGFGAFADCTGLTSVSFTNSFGCNIGEYAFYNCANLDSITFSDSNKFSFGKACFAMPNGEGVNCKLTTFNFPEILGDYKSYTVDDNYSDPEYAKSTGYKLKGCFSNEGSDGTHVTSDYNSMVGDYLLANRFNLKDVEISDNWGTTSVAYVPMETFCGCRDLGKVTLGDSTNQYLYFDKHVFEDVENRELYVHGPKDKATTGDSPNDTTNYANPRYSTWLTSTKTLDYVPYEYIDGMTDHYEVGIDSYRYELQTNSDGTASLLSCNFTGAPADIEKLIIPSNVASYKITDMQPDCLTNIKTYIKNLEIPDDSITSIGDNVFQGAEKLEKVYIGNSVTDIGSGAFSNCPVLEHVYWTAPNDFSVPVTLGTDSFKTGSPKLFFHGEAVNGYGPFDYAMGDNRINSDSTRICYMTPVPSDLKILKDDNTGYITLVDYPHFVDLPNQTQIDYLNGAPLTAEESEQISYTKNILLPQSVESIDVAKFMEDTALNKNKVNFVYISDTASVDTNGITKRQAYTDKNLNSGGELCINKYEDKGGYTPGLFSGEMYDGSELIKEKGAAENVTKGNDWIVAIDMPGVKYIPDFCFDSCENLQSVIIGDDCASIGESAFLGCEELSTIGTSSNPKYTFDNGILYENLPDGTYELNTCLPARGKDGSSTGIWVNSSNDPKLNELSSIREGAFAGCPYITKVNLSETDLTTIPGRTFENCKSLSNVELPDTIRSIAKRSFNTNSSSLDVTIPCDSNISDEAFSKSTNVTIRTYDECGITKNYNPMGYDRVKIEIMDGKHNITYLNDDLSVYEVIDVPHGYTSSYPDKDPVSKIAGHDKWTFAYWKFDNTNGIKNVTENRQAIAVFNPPADSSASSNNAGGNGTNGNGTNGNGNGTNGNGTNNNNSASNNSASQNSANTAKKYVVTVENGAGGGSYEPGKVVTITAYAPADGKTFDKWTTSNTDIGFSNATNTSTTFIMPTHDVKVTATFKSSTDSKGNNSSVSGNNTSVPPKTNNGSSTNNGTSVDVTSDAIDNNKKNLASATVAGSTDNFIIKVTDSAYASAEVEKALKAKYGNDLSDIKYVAFDISLYDSTGTRKIENSDQLAVTITLPIPDDLVSYAGNNKAAAVINGAIDDKTVKFTTIDGVPCMTFTATHFSPYTIYVDLNNVVYGNPDLTPKTGIDIAPKWFLASGLAFFSGVLFLWKDKKKVKKPSRV